MQWTEKKSGTVTTGMIIAQLMFCCIFAAGCSLRTMAVNRLSDALAGGTKSFSSDDDPELVRTALPFGLKITESLLEENPRHRGLLLAASSSFTQYSYAFVLQEADEREAADWSAAERLRQRARGLFLRAREYGLRGIEVNHSGFRKAVFENPEAALQETVRGDVPLLFWSAVSWASAISVSKSDPDLVADLPFVEAMIDRALALDEEFDAGSIHTFLISFESARANAIGAEERSRKHFDRALELSGGLEAGPFLALAESVSIAGQDRAGFEALLNRALQINVNAKPESRLENLILQRRARWLLSRADRLFSGQRISEGMMQQ